MFLKEKIQKDKISAMKDKNKELSNALTLVIAKIKQHEIDERTSLDENDQIVLSILVKMKKERSDSFNMYKEAGRTELANQESFEISVIEAYMPKQLTTEEIDNIVNNAINEVNPQSMKDMGKVMSIIKPQVAGKADLGSISGMVRAKIS